MTASSFLLDDPSTLHGLREALLDHYDRHGRALPWRAGGDLYPIWLSEMMLQQTGVGTVIPYFHRFLERFPTVTALAAAPLEEVLALWQGLGYYRRARHLHAAAQVIASQGGSFPATREGMARLPGIGRSTAGAILAIGLGQREAILDGNVKRVLTRLLALDAPAESVLWQAAERLTSPERPGDYAQAIMDLGATVCLPRRPGCASCPWRGWCLALAAGATQSYPRAASTREKPRFVQEAVVVRRVGDGAYLLLLRPATGLLAGMWEPPRGERQPPETAAAWGSGEVADWLKARHGIEGEGVRRCGVVRHTFTHFHLAVTVHACLGAGGEAVPGPEHAGARWVGEREVAGIPMATLHRKVLACAEECKIN